MIKLKAETESKTNLNQTKDATPHQDDKTRREQTVDEAVRILWKIIDEAKIYLEDTKTTADEKRRWAKVLSDTIGVLNKLLSSKSEKPLEDEALGVVLQKVPRRLRLSILQGVRKWRKKNF